MPGLHYRGATSLGRRILALARVPRVRFDPDGESVISLWLFRVALVLASILYPLFGIVYHATHPGAQDPMVIRLALSSASLAFVAASYRWAWVRRNCGKILVAFAYVDIVWIAGLAYANALSPDYAVGLLFVFTVAALLASLSFRHIRPLLRFLVVAVIATVAVAFAVPEPGVSPWLLLLSTFGVAGGLYFTVAGYLQAVATARDQQTAMEEAQRVAQIGTWEADPQTGRVHWSRGMYHLLGLDPRTTQPRMGAILEQTIPGDRPKLQAAIEEAAPHHAITIRTKSPAGTLRAHRLTYNVERDGRHRPTRYFGTLQDVTTEVERAQALVFARDEAERARQEAEDLSNLKSTLLANMSHEIRTPLTAIVGFSDLLAQEVEGDARECVDLIRASGHRLMHTLNSVLDLARLRSGTLEWAVQPVDLGHAVEAVAAMLQRQAQEKDLAVELDLPERTIWAQADPTAIERIITNLLSNAIKFTEEGRVTVSLTREHHEAVLTVTDTGIGISPAFLPRLFDEFRQESEGLTRLHEGAGLGLAITRQLILLMGGRICVKSSPGEGSAFTVYLPAAPARNWGTPLAPAPPADFSSAQRVT
jgi:signal transduction histidine kinase